MQTPNEPPEVKPPTSLIDMLLGSGAPFFRTWHAYLFDQQSLCGAIREKDWTKYSRPLGFGAGVATIYALLYFIATKAGVSNLLKSLDVKSELLNAALEPAAIVPLATTPFVLQLIIKRDFSGPLTSVTFQVMVYWMTAILSIGFLGDLAYKTMLRFNVSSAIDITVVAMLASVYFVAIRPLDKLLAAAFDCSDSTPFIVLFIYWSSLAVAASVLTSR